MVLQRAPERAILWGYADVIDDQIVVWMDGVLVVETNVYNESSDGKSKFLKKLVIQYGLDIIFFCFNKNIYLHTL